MKSCYLILLLIALASCNTKPTAVRETIDLSGIWHFDIDTADIGIQQNWFLSDLKDSVKLPGTTDLNKKGFLNTDTITLHLSRVYKYEGAAWYRKKVVIPESFRNKHVLLSLERTKCSMIWIDSCYVGSSRILQSPQQFNLSDFLTPGDHFITIRIDNSLKQTPYGNVHIYSDDTQTNWNGIIGKLSVESSAKTYITNLQVYPDIENKKILIRLEIEDRLNLKEVNINLRVAKIADGKVKKLRPKKMTLAVEPVLELEYNLGKDCSLWDEYKTPVYSLTAEISNGEIKDSKTVPFGMRKYTISGTQFNINGRTVFLRGKNDAAVFPLTGHVPMDAKEWTKVFTIARSYGINHYRYHSYCPPEAAFTAADRVGIYIQAELPFWGGLDSDSLAEQLREEGFAMLKAYANHPSFVMFSHGNEIWNGHDRVEKNIIAFKESDNRLLYTMGSNNNIGYAPPLPCSDYFVGARTPFAYDTILTHTRLTQAFADSKDGGLLNTQYPSTEIYFDYPVSQIKIPIISHEVGQYQIYPDYREIDKYTGVLRAWNLEIFRNRLIKAGMFDQDTDFQKASGAWAAICYKAEMEAAIRTKGFGGFQLLDLQDFPGQGTALVGILDAFMDSKNVISHKAWKQSCNDVTLLLEFPKYCWTRIERFRAKTIIANYSNQTLCKDVNWEIRNQDGVLIQQGTFSGLSVNIGEIKTAGEVEVDLSSFSKAEKLNVLLSMAGTDYSNNYPVWVFDNKPGFEAPEEIILSEALNEDILNKLQQGAKVLLFPESDSLKEKCIPGLFPPEFWNYGMFKGISEHNNKPVSPGTLGILTDPRHPLFHSFPTDFHTNWQWFSIIKAGCSFILDNTPGEYRPIVQVIDNLERNHKLGLIFEFKYGKGKILVCMSPLRRITGKPEAAQLYHSIITYMQSDDFNPDHEITQEVIKDFFDK